MAQQLYTSNQMKKAEALAELIPTFSRGRDKHTGIEYVTVPSSDDPEHKGHNTNGLRCTCRGFERRNACTHALAVTIWSRQGESERWARMHPAPKSAQQIYQERQARAAAERPRRG